MVEPTKTPTKIKQIKASTKLPEQISKAILDYISDNKFQPGDKLPPEKELSYQLNVSLRSVREALKMLDARGLVEIVHGKGLFVSNNTFEKFFSSITYSQTFYQNNPNWKVELTNFRIQIETQAIVILAKNNNEEILYKLEKLVIEMEKNRKKRRHDAYNRADIKFHKLIVNNQNNSIISSIYDELIRMILLIFKDTVSLMFEEDEKVDPHTKILDLIRSKDHVGAKKMMIEHIEKTKFFLLS